jgi:hypothetical protein
MYVVMMGWTCSPDGKNKKKVINNFLDEASGKAATFTI